MDVLSSNNCSLRLLSCLGLLVTSIFGSYVLAPYQNVDAQEATPADQPPSTFASSNNESSTAVGTGYGMSVSNTTSNISGTFDMSQLVSGVDFKIDLPEGWTGFSDSQFYPVAMVSPEGITPSTMSKLSDPPAIMTILASNSSVAGMMSMSYQRFVARGCYQSIC